MQVKAERIADLSSAVRHVAVSDDRSEPEIRERNPRPDSSSSESDRYEELLVNPTLLTLAGRRGDIDCGGLDYLPVRYGSFFQFVVPTPSGHISVCLNPDAGNPDLTRRVVKVLALDGGSSSTQETSHVAYRPLIPRRPAERRAGDVLPM